MPSPNRRRQFALPAGVRPADLRVAGAPVSDPAPPAVGLNVLSFMSPAAPGATAGLPLRAAEIESAAAVPGQLTPSLQALRVLLSAQRRPYRPAAVTIVAIARRLFVLRIEYPAPSPLGLLGSHI